MLKLVIKELEETLKDLEKEKKLIRSAAKMALRVEGYRLHENLTQELGLGRVAGRRLKPLREISRAFGRKDREPYDRLMKIIKYSVFETPNELCCDVGFLGLMGRKWRRELSQSYKKIVVLMEGGGTFTPKETARKAILSIGISRKKRKRRGWKYFFLKKDTTRFTMPTRPVITPFWNANRYKAQQNIERNWEKKMRGERI